MRRSLSSRFLFLLMLPYAVPASGATQVDSLPVPMDLVLALLSGQTSDARVFIGAPAPEAEGSIPLGATVRVVGAVARASSGTVVVEVAGDARQALTNYSGHLQEQGWKRPAMPPVERGGFQQTNPSYQNTWCGEGYSIRGSSLTLNSRTYLRINYTRREVGRNACDLPAPGTMPRLDPYGGLRFPDLEPPPGAVVQGGGGGGSSNSIETVVTIVSDLSLGLIFEHYARQLTAAGWIPDERAMGQDVAIGRWRTQDEGGEPVVATMGAWALMGQNSYRVSLRMDGPDHRR